MDTQRSGSSAGSTEIAGGGATGLTVGTSGGGTTRSISPSRPKHASTQKKSNDSGVASSRGRRKSPVSSRRSEGTPSSSCSGRGSHHGSQEDNTFASMGQSSDEVNEGDPPLSNGSDVVLTTPDETDGTPQLGRVMVNIRHLQSKTNKTMELIREEQRRRDDNVNEYLKLSSQVDRQQVPQVKAVFEKKNQRSAQAIAQLQKKMERYQKQMGELESQAQTMTNQSQQRMQNKGVLRDVGQGLRNVGGNIKEGISGLSGSVMAKPRGFAHMIKNKFGSADNINNLSSKSGNSSWYIPTNDQTESDTGGVEEERSHHGSATLPGHLGSSRTTEQDVEPTTALNHSKGGSECSSSVTNDSNLVPPPVTSLSPSKPHAVSCGLLSDTESIWIELRERKDDFERIREEFEQLKLHVSEEMSLPAQALSEERFRSDRLEEQMNDLTELHQTEMENMKQAVLDVEEKMLYQNEERLRDIHDLLESCQTKISRMEQQQAQQQQYVTLEGLENSQARAMAVKLINVLLTVLQVVLLLVATAAGILMPFLKTRARILTTVAFVGFAIFFFKQWPDVQQFADDIVSKYQQYFGG